MSSKGKIKSSVRSKPIARAVFCALAGLGLGAVAPSSMALPAGTQIDMKLLVIGQTGEPSVDTVTTILKRVGIPYELKTYAPGAALPAITTADLEDGVNHAYYQGIIFAVSDTRMNPYYPDAWFGTQASAKALEAYSYKYSVRIASFYGWPANTGCMKVPAANFNGTIGATPVNALLTAAGKTALPYLKAGTSASFPLPLKNTYYYPATALPASGAGLPGVDFLPPGAATPVPWLTYNSTPIASACKFTVDSNALPPGVSAGATRELLALTVNNAPYLLHSMALSYGIVNWVTKGVHLGEKQVWLDPEIDDLFLPDDEYPYTILDDGNYYNFEAVTRYLVGLDPSMPAPLGTDGTCGVAQNPATGSPCEYRNLGTDIDNVVSWQNKARTNAWAGAKTINNKTINTANANGTDGLRLSMVYNGVLATLPAAEQPCGTLCEAAWPNDTLTTAVENDSFEFKWINHTWDHSKLDLMPFTATGACPKTVLDAKTELCWNHAVQQALGLAKYDKAALVTPEITGLYNRDALDAMAIFGTQVLVSDTSKPTPPEGTPNCPPNQGVDGSGNPITWPLPEPNAGKYNCTALTTTATRTTRRYIYEVPRLPVSLFYLVTTPTEWTNAYNFFYGANHILPIPAVFPFVDASGNPRNQSYAEIVNYVSDTLLGYLLSYDNRPLMFHVSNLRKYSGTRFLLGDLLEETLTKYNAFYQNQPIRSPRLKATGDRMKQRMVYNAMKVQAVLKPGQSPTAGQSLIAITADASKVNTLTQPLDANSVRVPVTGVSVGSTPGPNLANNPMTYGAQTISYISLTPTTSPQYSTEISAPVTW
jgi:hypothetical protein